MQSEKNKEQTMKKKVIMVVLVIVMIASFAGTALAEPPTQLRWEEPFYVEVDCGDYDLIIDDTARIALTLFSDQNNNPYESAIHVLFEGTITNTGTGSVFDGGGVLSGRNPWDGGRIRQGVYYHITVPGEGVVTLAAGHVVLDVNNDIDSVAGPGMFEIFGEPGEEAWLCETLEGY
jgi:hypothetical protein